MRKGPPASARAWARRHVGAFVLFTASALLLLFARGGQLLSGAAGIALVILVVGIVRPETFQHVLRRRSALLNVVIGVALLVVTLVPTVARVDRLTSVVDAIVGSVAKDAAIYVAEEMFDAGAELLIVPDVGDTIQIRLDTNSYFAIVDDEPGAKFGHPVHYVIVSTDATVRSIDQQWLPTVNAIRWTIDDEREVAGHRVVGLTNADFPFPRVEIGAAWPPSSVAAAAGRKIALVIDGGDKQREWTEPFARKLDEDSRAIAGVLEDRGYDVRRYGGYRGSVVPAARIDDVTREIARIGREASSGDEVVIYLNGHGTRDGGFVLRGRDGSREVLGYAELASALGGIPTNVPVRVIIDACFSGTASGPLSARDNTIVLTATDATHTAPGGLGADPTFSDVIVASIKDKRADIDGDGTVALDEALAVSGKAFAKLGSNVVASKGAPRIPTAKTVAGPAAVAVPAGVAAPVPAAPVPAVAPPAAAPTLVPVALPPAAAPLRFVAGAPPRGTAGQRYADYSFCAPKPATPTSACGPFPETTNPSGGSPPYHFQLGSGVGFPPIGMSVSKDGILSGTPASAGTYTFSVCATDLEANSICQTVTMTVGSPATPTPAPCAGTAYAGTWTATLNYGRIPNPASTSGGFMDSPNVSGTFTFGTPVQSGSGCYVPITAVRTNDGRSWVLNRDYPYNGGVYDRLDCTSTTCDRFTFTIELTGGPPINNAKRPIFNVYGVGQISPTRISGQAGTGEATGGCCGAGSFTLTKP